MDSTSRLYSQVAAMADCAPEKAMAACYLLDLSRAGKMLNDAAQLMRTNRASVRTIARNWGIAFVDYVPAKPLKLTWVKERPGKWVLGHNGKEIAQAVRKVVDGLASYEASTPDRNMTADGSSAEVACRLLSAAFEEMSVEMFGVDDVVFEMPDVGTLAPKSEPLADQFRRALSA